VGGWLGVLEGGEGSRGGGIGGRLVDAEGRWSSLVVSALIVGPQIIVALLAPWVGRTANSWGRRPLLLIGLGVLPIRSTFFALTTDPALLVVVRLLVRLLRPLYRLLPSLV